MLKSNKNIWHREENQLDATEWFIAHTICSTCFGHLHAHHQELETMLVLLPHMVCDALVAGTSYASEMREVVRPPSSRTHSHYQQPRHHTPYAVINTSIASSSRWWACMWPKQVQQIINAINHSVASSWFCSLCLNNDALTNIHQEYLGCSVYLNNNHWRYLCTW